MLTFTWMQCGLDRDGYFGGETGTANSFEMDVFPKLPGG